MMTCCKEKAVFVAVYEEKPRKRRLTTKNTTTNIKHHHHHHHHYHHHHLQVHQTKKGEGNNRKAELLSYSNHLRQSSKSQPSVSPKRPKSLVASTSNNVQQTINPVSHVQEKQKLKKQPNCLDMNNMFKCFAVSKAKRKVKKKKTKENSESPAKKSSAIMKTFNARTQKGARRFFSKVMATIQKYR